MTVEHVRHWELVEATECDDLGGSPWAEVTTCSCGAFSCFFELDDADALKSANEDGPFGLALFEQHVASSPGLPFS